MGIGVIYYLYTVVNLILRNREPCERCKFDHIYFEILEEQKDGIFIERNHMHIIVRYVNGRGHFLFSGHWSDSPQNRSFCIILWRWHVYET
jgi:hypothetical protein